MAEPSGDEAALVEAGCAWLDDHEDLLLDLLADLVARPSLTGEGGTHDDPTTTVGHLWSVLAEHDTEDRLEAQPIPAEAEPSYVDRPRENVYAVLEGADGGGFLALSHTDTVGPGAHAAWPDDAPFEVSTGTVSRLDDRTIELAVDGERHERGIRGNLADVWDLRGTEAAEVLVGRGVYDNKAPTVCLVGCYLGLAAALASTGRTLGGDFVGACLVDEEKAQVGVKNLVGWAAEDDGRQHADWLGERYDDLDGFGAVVLEGQYGFVPVVGHRGGINLTVTARGESVHGSTPELGRNAVLGMAKALAAMDEPGFVEAVTSPFVDDELLGAFTVAPGTTIAGGDIDGVDASSNTVHRAGGAEYAVADWCEATVDCRIPRWPAFPEGFPIVHERFLELVRLQAARAAPEVDFDVRSNMVFLPVAMGDDREAARNHPLVRSARRATSRVSGYEPDIAVAPGATDAWVLYHGTHVPTLVEYGPAGALSHEPLEFVERDQVLEGAKVLLALVVDQLGLA